MKLSNFIETSADQIIDSWEEFAREIPSARKMAAAKLRDHASGILNAIVVDLNRPQTREEQKEKSLGHNLRDAKDTYAALHGEDREFAGFSISEAISEFRALRASVFRLGGDANPGATLSNDELTRFNEAIDQALSVSLEEFSTDLKRYAILFHSVLASPPDLNCIFDTDYRLIYANDSFATFYGLSATPILGKNFQELGASNAAALELKLHHVATTKAIFRGEIPCTLTSGNEITYDYFFVPVLNDEGNVETILVTARDISERKKLAEKNSKSANYDSLTGLTNRSLFRDRMEWEVKRSERTGWPTALFFIDLDGFKEVNDLLGHDAGDLLLQQAAQRIGACVRGSDTVARIGGDEFTVILSAVNKPSSIDIVAQEIVDALARPFKIQDSDIQISGSIGITIYPQDATTTESLVRNADQAMYAAKKAGGGRFNFFDADMRDSASARLKLIDGLRHALPQGEFCTYYQPIVELPTGRIVKAEALIRWRHPQRGLVLPTEFIGLAEEIGLIGEIDDWVFGDALQCSQRWSALMGAPFQISVNKSATEFTSKTPMKNLCAYLAASRVSGGSMCVEITESVLLNDLPIVMENLDNLQKAGIQLALDDFGTGYASMSFLNKFQVDYLKIDRSFVQDMGKSAHSRIFAETIIVMAHKLGLKVIAEGVETVAQKDLLKAAGCDYAQGYLFSRPLPFQAFETLLTLNQAEHRAPN